MRNILVGCTAALCLTVAAVSAQQSEPVRKTAARNPAFAVAQADRGKLAYDANCSSCHLPGLDGSANATANARGAPLVGPRFVQDFGESKISDLFNKMKRDMPAGKAGTLSDQQYLDIAAYVLQQNRFPAGPSELTVETATDIWVPGAGGAEGLVDNTYVAGVGCLNQDPTRSWMLTRAQGLKKTDAAAAMTVAFADAPGEYTFRLLNAYNHAPEPHNGHKMRVSGYLVRLGAEIRVYVQDMQMVSASCSGSGATAAPGNAAPVVAPQPPPQAVAPPRPVLANTVWSGVYSDAQAYNGEKVADTACQGCHGAGLAGGDSGPKLVGADFLARWNGRSARDLFEVISRTMPENAPGTLKPEDVAAVVAYILKVNDMPAGRQALPTEQSALSPITFQATKP